jgi:hypothetical protein
MTTMEATSSDARFQFNSAAQYLAHVDQTHRRVLLFGGVGSGKTATHPLWLIDRSTFDTDQLHGVFTNTEKQLLNGVLPEIKKWCTRAGIEIEYDRKPPRSWFARWAREGIEIPPVTRYRNMLTASTGLHALCGTLFNQSYTQYQTIQFGSLRIEEVPNISQSALTFMIERLRCGSGRDVCRKRHRHQAYLLGNPPLGSHWLFDYLDTLEENAKRHYDGPAIDHRDWPLLRMGVGDTILITSRTSDNVENLNEGYEDSLASGYDRETARRRLHGELVRETGGTAYTEWSDRNLRSVDYDPNATLYLCLDFNIEPRVAVLAHPLRPGQYPSEHQRNGVEHVGVFGEFFSLGGGMSDRRFAEALVRGDRGVGGSYPQDDLRGLPANWKGLREHRGKIIAFGDAVGNHRSVHSDNLESSWQIVDSVFSEVRDVNGRRLYQRSVPEANPAPRARVHSVNAKLMNALGVPSLWIDQRCRELTRDFERVVWDDDGVSIREWRRGNQGTEWHRTHLSDALGYMVHQLFPMGKEADRTMPDFGKAFGSSLEPPTMR